MPKISIIPSLIGSIISGALSLTGMSVKGTIFQAHSSQDSVTFLLTEAQNGNYFSFHYELSLFHLGTAMIDFHSSSVLPFLEPLTHTDTMQNAGILVQAVAILRKGWGLSWFAILNIYMYWKCWNAWCGRLAMLMGHALFLHVLIKPGPQPQVKLKGWQRTAQLPSLYPSGRRVESLLKLQGSGGKNRYILRKKFLLRLLRRMPMPMFMVTDPNYGRSFGKNTSPHGRTYWAELERH